MNQDEEVLSEVESVRLQDGIVRRPASAWSPSVHALLRHLEEVDFPASPRTGGRARIFLDGNFPLARCHQSGRQPISYRDK
ncbi:hypothetical protein [Cohnella zeiphila]|uniref:hypothetical protein n=1 Tax=Cohnella zeiphila TaxID=2761120 RepID=UPI00192D483B|nr:hypothetical protein [Cohnella zeiphila]